jgi:PPP family 3-phenylpropionic acid transporter
MVANLAWIVRATGYAMFDQAWIVLILELFHGITFGLFYSAAVYICVQTSPKGMESTMQSLLDMTYGGFGVAIGTVGGGYLFDSIGTVTTFLLFVCLIFLSTILIYRYFDESTSDATKVSELGEISTEKTIISRNFEIEEARIDTNSLQ